MSTSLYQTKVESSAPTTSTQGVVGNWYIDTSTTPASLYLCTKVNSNPTSYEWTKTSPTYETYTISSWSALSSSEPYTYSATVTATYTIGANTLVELINDQAVLFGTYGFAAGAVSGQIVTIYSIGEPSADVTLKIGYGG